MSLFLTTFHKENIWNELGELIIEQTVTSTLREKDFQALYTAPFCVLFHQCKQVTDWLCYKSSYKWLTDWLCLKSSYKWLADWLCLKSSYKWLTDWLCLSLLISDSLIGCVISLLISDSLIGCVWSLLISDSLIGWMWNLLIQKIEIPARLWMLPTLSLWQYPGCQRFSKRRAVKRR